MPEAVPFTYRAFLSYSHRDKEWAAWLHRELEHTRIDKDLVGRQTPVGPVPATLRPVFRDRDDFAAGHSLTEQTLAALEASQFLVAICSPNAARSSYVNEEIRRFKAMGRADRIIPLIVEGEPGDPERECFPPAIRFKLNADGSIGTEPEEPIAADAREIGDGKRAALIKITAGLLGVRLDEIIRRADRARARHRRLWGAIGGAFLLLIAGGSAAIAYGYHKSLENDDLMNDVVRVATGFVSEAARMSDRLGIPADVPLALLTRADAALSSYIAKGKDSPKLRHRRAFTLLDLATIYQTLGQIGPALERSRAATALLEALNAGESRNREWRHDLATAYTTTADNLLPYGKATEALALYRKGQAVRESILHDNPDDPVALRELSVSYERIGDTVVTQGDLGGAAEAYATLIALRERLVKVWQSQRFARHELAVAYSRAGYVAFQRSLFGDALQHYRAVLAIEEKLVAEAPASSVYLRDLGVAHMQVANTLLAQADRDRALTEINAALEIHQRLATSDPTNATWQQDLASAYENRGNQYSLKEDWHAVEGDYRAAYAIRLKLANADPKNVGAARALSSIRVRIASALAKLGRLDDALTLYREDLASREKLAVGAPPASALQLDVAQAYWAIADFLVQRRAFDEAQAHYAKSRDIIAIAAEADKTNTTLERQLGYAYLKIGTAYQEQGARQSAIEAYRKCLAIREPLAAASPRAAVLWIEVVFARWSLADLGEDPVTHLTEIVAILRRLKDENLLAPTFANLLPDAETLLAKLKP